MNGTVYLAGPISHGSYTDATEWRDYARSVLNKMNIRAFSPLRAKELLSDLTNISCTGADYSHRSVLCSPRSIITRDRFDATRCDVLLVNLIGARQVSVGTVMEIAWADLARIPIVCAIEEDGTNPHEHMMVNEAIGFRCKNLDEALHVTASILAES